MNVEKYFLRFNQNQEVVVNWTPEMTLIAAILQRAIRDLGERLDAKRRSELIKWFRCDEYSLNNHVCFQDCVNYLELNERKVKLILAYVDRLESSYGQSKAEGKQSRKRGCKLVKGERLHLSQTHPTV